MTTAKPKLEPASPVSASSQDDELPASVSHGYFVAKKYIHLMANARRRGIEFRLTIEELSELLRTTQCYFTGAPLTKDVIEDGKAIPDSHLSVDRIDSTRGYVSGNIVLCGHGINLIKASMAPEKFQQVVATMKMMQGSMDAEQIAAMQRMQSAGIFTQAVS